jgi:hypothetical protein
MITETGKNILAKYMIGQAPAYASYLSFGSGPKALSSSEQFSNDPNSTSMKFEMFRSPIVSRGYVTQNLTDENGVIQLDPETQEPIKYSEIVFTAQLPTDERYEITEVGVWSAGGNPSAGSNDSRMLFAFSESENWEHHTALTAVPAPKITAALDEANEQNTIEVTQKVFQANSDNTALDAPVRYQRNERPRFLNNSLFVRGDVSSVSGTGSSMTASGEHVHLNGVSLNLDKNSGSDEIRIAFSLINKFSTSESPSDVKIIVEFSTPEDGGSPQYARLKAHLTSVSDGFSTNRYFVVSKKIEDLEKSQSFSWQSATVVKIYASIIDDGEPSEDFYLAFDGIRLENLTTQNPLYGLVGYTQVKTESGLPIIKQPNTSNLLEFRFAMDVQ